MVDVEFTEDFLRLWCVLYVRFVIRDKQRLATVVSNCGKRQLQERIVDLPGVDELNAFVSRFAHEVDAVADDVFLRAYGYLQAIDNSFWHKPDAYLLSGVIETFVEKQRYFLTRVVEHPMLKAVPESGRFKFNQELGADEVLHLRHAWQFLEQASVLDMQRCEALDGCAGNTVRIGMSPFAGLGDMAWRHDALDERGLDGRIPFWCAGANLESELLQRLLAVLQAARKCQVEILILPELVMTDGLLTGVRDWLAAHNAFAPVLRLLIAGTRHVFAEGEVYRFSNRCSVFNFIGDEAWAQEKRQQFSLTAVEAQHVLGVDKAAFEPTMVSQQLVMRRSALGILATPICLDFLCDDSWGKMPVDVFLVPVMSGNLTRFIEKSREAGSAQRAAAFVCNAQPEQDLKAVHAYLPAKKPLECVKQTDNLFIVDVEINVN
jgi:hypothetical protein